MRTLIAVLAAVMLVAACAGRQESARKLLADVHAALQSASADAAKYAPGGLKDVEARYAQLSAAYARHDYAGVVERAPQVLSAARALAVDAASRRDAARRKLDAEWAQLAAAVPEAFTVIQRRLDAGGGDAAARAGLRAAESLWSKALAAFAAGNLDEAVSTAGRVRTQVDALTAGLAR